MTKTIPEKRDRRYRKERGEKTKLYSSLERVKLRPFVLVKLERTNKNKRNTSFCQRMLCQKIRRDK